MRRPVVTVAALVLLTGVLMGCSSASQAKAVAVSATNLAFDTKTITLEQGKPVKLTFTNKDVQLHDLSVDKMPMASMSSMGDQHEMGGMNPDLHISVAAGKSGFQEFTPKEKGTYTFYCTVAGHKEAGMVGTIVVN